MNDFSPDDERWMEYAIRMAMHASEQGEVPVGAVLIDAQGQLLGVGENSCITRHDPTAHAEINALRQACLDQQNYRIPGATLYVTLEPCAMCIGAIFQARVGRVVYGAQEPKTGVCGSVLDLPSYSQLNHQTTVSGGLLAEKCGNILKDFFRKRRLKQKRTYSS